MNEVSHSPASADGDGPMTFTQRLEAHARLVEASLQEWLTEARLGPAPENLLEAMKYGVLGGGKRIRPFLVIESAALFGIQPEKSVDAAAALECIHCYSLIHDDLPAMDNDDMRRGRPTVHRAFGESAAILAGDARRTRGVGIMASPRAHPEAAVRTDLCAGLARASGAAGLVGGQMLDLEAACREMDASDVLRMQAMKTGALITFAC